MRDQIAPLDVGELVQEHVLGVPAGELAQVAPGHQQDRTKHAEHRRGGEPLGHDDLRNIAQLQAPRTVGQLIVEGLRQ